MTDKPNQTRRQTLKKFGAGLATVSFVGTASGKKTSLTSLNDIDSRVLEAYNDNGEDGVHKVMAETGYDYNVTTSSKTFKSEDNSDISPDARYLETYADLMVNVFDDPEGDDRVRVQVITTLDGTGAPSGYGTWAEDATVITYDGNEWTNVGEASLQMSPSEGGTIGLYPAAISSGGVGGVVDLDSIYTDTSQNILLAQSLTNLNGNPGTIYGSYKHTWSANPFGASVDGIEGGVGPATISFSGVIEDDWQIVDDEGTDNLI
ncbi:hypothetical protein [Halorubrum tropicale]|jgi:hypothetical protein|uniref:hypothetical protein n=1 Tax=Halorubrum tropicale TaxID=1765655 RepID=UPI000AF4F332|nr:hypothetical protein [Halorubrum tropicale]